MNMLVVSLMIPALAFLLKKNRQNFAENLAIMAMIYTGLFGLVCMATIGKAPDYYQPFTTPGDNLALGVMVMLLFSSKSWVTGKYLATKAKVQAFFADIDAQKASKAAQATEPEAIQHINQHPKEC